MRPYRRLEQTTWGLAALLACKVNLMILANYGDYFPPNFRSDFLLGRGGYFFGSYQAAFYAHITAGPFALLAGLLLLSSRFRQSSPSIHRKLGRVHVLTVLCLVAPSGFWMAWWARGGAVATAGFATLSIATACCAALGWREAVNRRFEQHRLWMLRCYLALSSTVVLRLAGGASELLSVEGAYPILAWLSWLGPLAILEAVRATRLGTPRPRWSSSP